MREELSRPTNTSTTPAGFAGDGDALGELKRYFYLLLSNWYWIALGVAICGLLAWLFLRYSTDIYEIRGTVLISSDRPSRGISEEMIVRDIGFQAESSVEDELQRLRSTELLLKVVDSLELDVEIEQEGRIKNSERYGDQRPFRLRFPEGYGRLVGKTLSITSGPSAETIAVTVGESDTLWVMEGETFTVLRTPVIIENVEGRSINGPHVAKVLGRERAARKYAGVIQLSPVGQSDVVRMTLEERTPEKAIDILNTLIRVFNESVVEEKNSSGRQTLAFIDERLDFITEELYEVEGEVESFRRRNDFSVDISTRATGYLAQLNETDAAIAELDIELDLLDDLVESIKGSTQEPAALPVGSSALQGNLATLVGRYNQLVYDRKQKLEAATPENPTIATYAEQLSYLRESILGSINTNREEILNRKAALQERMRPLESRLNAIPANERALLQIMRQQQVKEQLFLFLLQKREETALGIAAQTVNSRILDKPYNRGPIFPNRPQIYLFALVLGMVLPITIILLRDIFDDKIYGQKDIERHTRAPFIGAVGASRKKEVLVVSKGSRSGVAEMFRLLRTNLQFMGGGKRQQVILVTSTVSGEGKTFVTINLGMSLALTGKRVLLLGFDLRKPKLSRYLTGKRVGAGLSTYLVGQSDLSELIQRVPDQENIDFIGSGPTPPNPAELLMGQPINELFTQLREDYDYILVDTAPVGLVTDAFILANQVDQSIMVTRFGVTISSYLNLAEDIYQKQKLPRFGIILNGVEKKKGYGGYGAYGAYGGNGGYGYYEE